MKTFIYKLMLKHAWIIAYAHKKWKCGNDLKTIYNNL